MAVGRPAGVMRCGVCGLRDSVGAASDRTDFRCFGSFKHSATYICMYISIFMIRGFGRYSANKCARSLANNLHGTKRFRKFYGWRAAVIDGFQRGANGDRCPNFHRWARLGRDVRSPEQPVEYQLILFVYVRSPSSVEI